ncbi:hypothetical protein PRK78_004263 [Emydomyces testavorans]|uniref:Altered inheritance of mitochondria protein 9, mitochondrial n=1 Tax=Emydomyces testavorans TaxID=2070801 RepID=A0AAF0IIG2_9EURO|nr:hypothetical protein PRK78_004263 [Emydomyces testavorans]
MTKCVLDVIRKFATGNKKLDINPEIVQQRCYQNTHWTRAAPIPIQCMPYQTGRSQATRRKKLLLLTPQINWNNNADFFNFTRGRFVVDEREQMSRRHVRFNMNELALIAAKSVGARFCVDIQKCADGMFNKAYIFLLDNGRQVIGKVPNPNAGISHYTTASEVATIDFMRNVLKTPAPEVYAWNSRVDSENAVGAEYIIMEKLDGIPLGRVWPSLLPPDNLN